MPKTRLRVRTIRGYRQLDRKQVKQSMLPSSARLPSLRKFPPQHAAKARSRSFSRVKVFRVLLRYSPRRKNTSREPTSLLFPPSLPPALSLSISLNRDSRCNDARSPSLKTLTPFFFYPPPSVPTTFSALLTS